MDVFFIYEIVILVFGQQRGADSNVMMVGEQNLRKASDLFAKL